MAERPKEQTDEVKAEVFAEDSPENAKKAPEASPLEEFTLDEKKTAEFKNSSNEFFHFVRLMQLFPSVHPATLHTVMTISKNDFFLAVDRLLYAKRCKELFDRRRRVLHTPSRGNRSAPYCCAGGDCCPPSTSCSRTSVKPESGTRRGSKKSRGEKSHTVSSLRLQLQQQDLPEIPDIPESPITLQCNVPLRPLSPIIHKITEADNIESVEEVEVVSEM